MFLGEFQHTLDAKGRVILPAKFRDQLEGGAVIAKTLDGCLAVYPIDEWGTVSNEVREIAKRGPQARQAARSFFAGAQEVEPDRQGRVAVPTHLRSYANLERDVVVAGVFSRIEIWDSETWRQKNAEGEQALAGESELSDFGI
jgi:MraZ protein